MALVISNSSVTAAVQKTLHCHTKNNCIIHFILCTNSINPVSLLREQNRALYGCDLKLILKDSIQDTKIGLKSGNPLIDFVDYLKGKGS